MKITITKTETITIITNEYRKPKKNQCPSQKIILNQCYGRTKFLYDSTGERTVKREKFTEIMYISKYTQLKDKAMYTKHIFLGNSRLVTKVCSVEDDFNDIEFEKRNQYFVHGDHLGSANWITDYQGNEYRLFINSPYGETFVEQGDKNNKIGYEFTGKIKDSTTGYHWFNPGRYYDSLTSRWLSCDSALEIYLPTTNKKKNLPGLGGVFNPINLNVYHYAGNNPIKYIDPDGRIVKQYTNAVMNFAWDHTFLIAIPDNQGAFKDYFTQENIDSGKVRIVGGTEKNPIYGIILRAGPESSNPLNHEKLTNEINLNKDDINKATSEHTIQTPNGKTDTIYKSIIKSR